MKKIDYAMRGKRVSIYPLAKSNNTYYHDFYDEYGHYHQKSLKTQDKDTALKISNQIIFDINVKMGVMDQAENIQDFKKSILLSQRYKYTQIGHYPVNIEHSLLYYLLDFCRRKCREKSLRSTKDYLYLHNWLVVYDFDWHHLERKKFIEFQNYLTGRGLSLVTIGKRMDLFFHFLESHMGEANNSIPVDLVTELKRIRIRPPKYVNNTKYIPLSVMRDVFMNVINWGDIDFFMYLCTVYFTSSRVGEVREMRKGLIDFKNRQFHIYQPKENEHKLIEDIPEDFMRKLKELSDRWKGDRVFIGKGFERYYSNKWKGLMQQLGYYIYPANGKRGKCLYEMRMLRHRGATDKALALKYLPKLLRENIIQHNLGHKSPKFVSKYIQQSGDLTFDPKPSLIENIDEFSYLFITPWRPNNEDFDIMAALEASAMRRDQLFEENIDEQDLNSDGV